MLPVSDSVLIENSAVDVGATTDFRLDAMVCLAVIVCKSKAAGGAAICSRRRITLGDVGS